MSQASTFASASRTLVGLQRKAQLQEARERVKAHQGFTVRRHGV